MTSKNYLFLITSFFLGFIISFFYTRKIDEYFILYFILTTFIIYIILYYLGNSEKESFNNDHAKYLDDKKIQDVMKKRSRMNNQIEEEVSNISQAAMKKRLRMNNQIEEEVSKISQAAMKKRSRMNNQIEEEVSNITRKSSDSSNKVISGKTIAKVVDNTIEIVKHVSDQYNVNKGDSTISTKPLSGKNITNVIDGAMEIGTQLGKLYSDHKLNNKENNGRHMIGGKDRVLDNSIQSNKQPNRLSDKQPNRLSDKQPNRLSDKQPYRRPDSRVYRDYNKPDMNRFIMNTPIPRSIPRNSLISKGTIPFNINISYNSNSDKNYLENIKHNDKERPYNRKGNIHSFDYNFMNESRNRQYNKPPYIGGDKGIYYPKQNGRLNSNSEYGSKAWTNNPDYYIPQKKSKTPSKSLNDSIKTKKPKENKVVSPLMINSPWAEYKSGDSD